MVNCGDRAVWPWLPVAGKDEIGLGCSEGVQYGVGDEGVAAEQHVVVAEQKRGAAGGVPGKAVGRPGTSRVVLPAKVPSRARQGYAGRRVG